MHAMAIRRPIFLGAGGVDVALLWSRLRNLESASLESASGTASLTSLLVGCVSFATVSFATVSGVSGWESGGKSEFWVESGSVPTSLFIF